MLAIAVALKKKIHLFSTKRKLNVFNLNKLSPNKIIFANILRINNINCQRSLGVYVNCTKHCYYICIKFTITQ